MERSTELINIDFRKAIISLVGVGKTFPLSWGNYWDAYIEYHGKEISVRMANVWYENLKHLFEIGQVSNPIQVEMFTFPIPAEEKDDIVYVAIVTDPRVPESYLYQTLCFTGHVRPPVDVATEMYQLTGATHEILKYSNPDLYYALRGALTTGDWVRNFNRDSLAYHALIGLGAKRFAEQIPQDEFVDMLDDIREEFTAR